jgi:hypothetical protein
MARLSPTTPRKRWRWSRSHSPVQPYAVPIYAEVKVHRDYHVFSELEISMTRASPRTPLPARSTESGTNNSAPKPGGPVSGTYRFASFYSVLRIVGIVGEQHRLFRAELLGPL